MKSQRLEYLPKAVPRLVLDYDNILSISRLKMFKEDQRRRFSYLSDNPSVSHVSFFSSFRLTLLHPFKVLSRFCCCSCWQILLGSAGVFGGLAPVFPHYPGDGLAPSWRSPNWFHLGVSQEGTPDDTQSKNKHPKGSCFMVVRNHLQYYYYIFFCFLFLGRASLGRHTHIHLEMILFRSRMTIPKAIEIKHGSTLPSCTS